MLKHIFPFIVSFITLLCLTGCPNEYVAPPVTYKVTQPKSEVTLTPTQEKELADFQRKLDNLMLEQAKNTPSDNIICAQEWVICKGQAAGSLIQSEQRQSLTTFWKFSSNECNINSACVNGLANGKGTIRWCSSSNICSENDLNSYYGQVTGTLNSGRYISENGKVIVTMMSARGLFKGEINTDGTYYIGVMEQINRTEKFLGLLDEQGYYKSGALHIDNKVILANNFGGTDRKTPLGRVIIGDANGNFTENECDINGCQLINQSHDDLISDLFGLLAGNKAENITVRGALTLLGEQAFLSHPALRGFFFLKDSLDVYDLIKEHNL